MRGNGGLFVIIQMMLNRGKQSKSDTPARMANGLHRPAQSAVPSNTLASAKKSDPFLRQLKEVFDKQNIHPNLKEQRTQSHHANSHPSKSPLRKTTLKQPGKHPRQPTMASHSNFAISAELPRAAKSRSSNRKSTDKDEIVLQEDYFPRRQRKMKVTLKDLKRQRHEQQECRQGDTRQTLTVDTPQQSQFHPNQQLPISVSSFDSHPISLRCNNHPQKRATHMLVDSAASSLSYCEKCAVGLATRGFQMTHVPCSESPPQRNLDAGQIREERLYELRNFLDEVEKMEPVFVRTARRVESYRGFLLSKLEEEGLRLDLYFNSLAATIRKSHEQSQQALKMHYQSALEELEMQAAAVQNRANELAELKSDIVPNVGQIVELQLVNQESFRKVITYNYARLADAHHLLDHVDSFTCTYYTHNFTQTNHLIPHLRSLILASLEAVSFELGFQTERKADKEEVDGLDRLDPFRMSFGKQGVAMRS